MSIIELKKYVIFLYYICTMILIKFCIYLSTFTCKYTHRNREREISMAPKRKVKSVPSSASQSTTRGKDQGTQDSDLVSLSDNESIASNTSTGAYYYFLHDFIYPLYN